MSQDEKMSLFLEMINCNYELYHWDYDSNLNFSGTNWEKSLFSHDIVSILDFRRLITAHLEKQLHVPLILEATNNLLWLAGFQYEEDTLSNMYLIGPILSGRDSHLLIRKKLDSYDLTVQLRSSIQKLFMDIPMIPSNVLIQYATMFHYCLNREKISFYDIIHVSTESTESTTQIQSGDHSGIWLNEEQLCKMFEEGNPHYKEVLSKSQALSSGVKAEFGDAMRSNKNNSLVLLTICSRSCIRGGLSPSIAYDLNDYYAKRIEECSTQADITVLNQTMLEDYVSRVREARSQKQISPSIQNSCDYICQHITEPLTISGLAQRTGYTEYYFSHKFKKEVGCSINEYILKEKIEQAKLLLSGTNHSIQDISDDLSFSSRSYFYSCFQKHTGLSPSEYRNQNLKL